MHDVWEDIRIRFQLRGFRPNTVAIYSRYIGKFLDQLDKPLEAAGRADVEHYLLGLVQRGVAARTRNVHLAILRFLFREVLDRPEVTARITQARVHPPLPTLLSGSEVQRLLDQMRSPTHRAMVATLYGAGLRVSELCHLRIADVDSKRMLLRIVGSKTGDRYSRLSPAVLEALRAHYKARRPPGPYLFPGRPATQPISRVAVAKALSRAATELGLTKRVYPHALRHSFAVHLLDLDSDLRTVQVLLGHRHITSTTHYLQLSRERLARAPSPLDVLGTPHAHRLG